MSRSSDGVFRSVCLLLVGLLLLAGGSTGQEDGGRLEHHGPSGPVGETRNDDHIIESFDGTELHATLWYNTSFQESPAPVILAPHAWSNDRHSMAHIADWLVGHGYVVLTWDARGFGESGGRVGLNGPDEWADVSAIIDWLTDDDTLPDGPHIRHDEGDPKIGMIGASYGGAIQLLASAHDDRIDAIVPDITWNDLVHSLAPDDVVKRGWVDLLFGNGPYAPERMDEALVAWFEESSETGRLPEDARGPLLERSPKTHMANVRAHALITHGWWDTLFLPDEASATYNTLAERDDVETHLLYHGAGHGQPRHEESIVQFKESVLDFFARHLHGSDVEPLPPVLAYEPTHDQWISYPQWPPHNQNEGRELTAIDVTGPVLLHMDPPGSGIDPEPSTLRFESGLQGPVTLQGRPNLHLTLTPQSDDIVLYLSLIETGLQERVIYNQVTPVRIEGEAGNTIEVHVDLPSLLYTVADGNRVDLRITTSQSGYPRPAHEGAVVVDTTNAMITLPVTGEVRDPARAPDPWADPLRTSSTVALILGSGLLVSAATIATGAKVKKTSRARRHRRRKSEQGTGTGTLS